MKNYLKYALSAIALFISLSTFSQTSTEVALVALSDIDVQYTKPDSYISYLNQRGISKDNVYKDYYTDKFVFDLGKMKTGTSKTIEIPFHNVSEHYVKITAVNEICACLKAEFPEGDAGKLKPGEVKNGKLTFNSKGLSGKVQRAVEVRTFTNRKEINYLVWVQVEITK